MNGDVVGVVRRRRTAPLDTTVSRLEAEIERLREGLRKYGRHFAPCNSWFGSECSCGLAALFGSKGQD